MLFLLALQLPRALLGKVWVRCADCIVYLGVDFKVRVAHADFAERRRKITLVTRQPLPQVIDGNTLQERRAGVYAGGRAPTIIWLIPATVPARHLAL